MKKLKLTWLLIKFVFLTGYYDIMHSIKGLFKREK